MKSFSLPVLGGCMGVSFAIGFGIAWYLQSPDPNQPPLAAPSMPQTNPQPGQNQFANVWNKNQIAAENVKADAHAVPGTLLDEQKLREQAMADPGALRSLIQRYDTERDQNTRDVIKGVIATIPKQEAKAFIAKLATSNDPAQRKEGYEMLKQAGPDSPEARNLLKQALATEQSPTALAQAVAAMRPVMVEPAESATIVAQLKNLTTHADPMVRSQSLLQLGQWDRSGANQDSLAAGLNDAAPEVRQAAIFAIAQSGARSDNLKTALLGMLNNPGETRENKGSALQILERFSLSKDEYASFTKARTQLGY